MRAGVYKIEVIQLCAAPSDCGSVDSGYQDLRKVDEDFAE